MVRQGQRQFIVQGLTVLSLLAWSGPALAQQGPRIPDKNALTILVRNTVIALNQANKTGNYTVFRDLGSANFRTANTSARLAGIFATLRKRNLDFSPIVLFTPQYKTQPIIDNSGQLRMAGKFPTTPLSVQFDLAYQWVGGRWLHFGIWVGTTPAATPASVRNTSRFETKVKPK